MNTELEDFGLIEKAGFTPDIKFAAQTTVAALHCLRAMSTKLGIPIEKITAKNIIEELSPSDARIQEHHMTVFDRSLPPSKPPPS